MEINQEVIKIDTAEKINFVLTKTSSFKNLTTNVLGGIRAESKAKFITKNELDKAENRGLDIKTDLFYGTGEKGNNGYLTNNERHLLLFLLATHDKNDEKIKEVEINLSFAKNIFNVKEADENFDYIKILKTAAVGLASKCFHYFQGLRIQSAPILKIGSGIVSRDKSKEIGIILNDALSQYFLVNPRKGNFTNIILHNILNLDSKSQALYIFLKRDYGYQNANASVEIANLYYSEKEVQAIFNSTTKNFPQFKCTLLKNAIEDININSTDMKISFYKCKAKEKNANSTVNKTAETRFEVQYNDKGAKKLDKFERIELAKNHILYTKIIVDRIKYKIKETQKHPVLKNTVSLKLITLENKDAIIFDYQINIDEFYRKVQYIVEKKIKQISTNKDEMKKRSNTE